MSRKKSNMWFGYLEAGQRSSMVVRDSSLDTGNPQTIYLFNLARARILEYRKDIVEPKLRELPADESATRDALQEAYLQAKVGFEPRGKPRMTAARQRPKRQEPEVSDFDDDQWSPIETAEPDLFSAEQPD